MVHIQVCGNVQILPTIQDKTLATVAANYVIWPAAHVISFKYVPSSQRILYNNTIAIFWNCYLSIMASGKSTPPSPMYAIDAVHDPSELVAFDNLQPWVMGKSEDLQNAVGGVTGSLWEFGAGAAGRIQDADAALAMKLGGLAEVGARVRDSMPFGSYWLHSLQVCATTPLNLTSYCSYFILSRPHEMPCHCVLLTPCPQQYYSDLQHYSDSKVPVHAGCT
jgi:hypothetical protein